MLSRACGISLSFSWGKSKFQRSTVRTILVWKRCNSCLLLQQNFSSCFRAHSEPRMPQSSEVTEHPSKAALMLAGCRAHHSTAICLTDGCVLIPVMSALLEMNAIESVTMTKCTCVYPSVAKAESSIFCSLIFNTFKKNEASAKE